MKKLSAVIFSFAVLGNTAQADPVEFIMKRVGTFRSEACGIGDFNKDGKLDIVAGPFWYEAPDWKAHKYRELRGKVDENGKGYWDEAGVKDGKAGLIRHQISSKNSVWGMGCGDINGDGRPDIVRPETWFEAPEDPRKGEWKAHPIALGTLGKEMPRHTPQIHVYDVNADGRNDIITGDAHGYGLFWYEQKHEGGIVSWKQHVIDSSWSQVHSINLGDLDGEGDLDIVVTGKWGGPVIFESQRIAKKQGL